MTSRMEEAATKASQSSMVIGRSGTMLAAVHRLFANLRCMSEDVDLSGAWNGQYFYPGEPEAVTFVALLIDTGGRFSGSIHEYEGIISERRILLYATFDGRHEGSQVSFLKTYDDTGGWT